MWVGQIILTSTNGFRGICSLECNQGTCHFPGHPVYASVQTSSSGMSGKCHPTEHVQWPGHFNGK